MHLQQEKLKKFFISLKDLGKVLVIRQHPIDCPGDQPDTDLSFWHLTNPTGPGDML
jgi:hypothetical protein